MSIALSRAQAASRGRGDRTETSHPQPWIEVQDRALIARARAGDAAAMDRLIERYRGFVRMKASAYFLAGGESEDLVQEGLIGFFKAVRDYRVDREASLLVAGKKAYLVYGNYEALLGYNCAHAYALAVSQLADRIRR